MNRIYRLTWNHALNQFQVTSELTTGSHGRARSGNGGPRKLKLPIPATLALALSFALFSILPWPVQADTGTAAGGGGTSAGQGAGSPIAAYNGGSAGINGPTAGSGHLAGAAGSSPGANGGDAGQADSSSQGAGGGGGGANGGTALGNASLKGGNGGIGGENGYSGGGGGGGGGIGAVLLGASGNLSNFASITGGTGGAGGLPSSLGNAGFGGGGGGGGGDGLYVSTSTSISLTLNAAITAGAGGNGGDSGSGGWNTASGAGGSSSGNGGASVTGAGGSGGGSGGGGGGGLYFTSAASGTTTLNNATTVVGGNGGNGGNSLGYPNGSGGNGGQGGVGVTLVGSNIQLINTGSIVGGNGGHGGSINTAGHSNYGVPGSAGDGGVGLVVTSGHATVTNSGSISGGLGGDGVTRADAIDLSGGGNTLVLETGSSIIGNVVSGGGDTLVLGGNSSPSTPFDVSSLQQALPTTYTGTQYIGFSQYAKTGSSTWTLSGNGNASENWTIIDGALQGDANTFAGNITFAPTAGDTASVFFNQGSGNANSPASATYAGTITGDGSLTKIGNGSLILSGANTYDAGTTINAGTLQLGNGTSGEDGSIVGAIQVAAGATFAMDYSGDIALANTITGNGTVVLQSARDITQDAGSNITADTLTGSSVGSTTLTDENAISNLGSFTAAGFSLTDEQGLTVVAGASVDGGSNTTLTTTGAGSGLTINGTVSGTTTTLTSADAISEGVAGVIAAHKLTGSSVGNVTLNANNQISTLGSFSAANFSLTSAQALTVDGPLTTAGGTGNISLTTTSGALSINTELTGSDVSLNSYSGLELTNDINATTADLMSHSDITQSSGVITADTLTGSSVGATTLNGANLIGTLGNFSANGFSLTNGQSLTLTAGDTVNGGSSTSLTTTSGNLTIDGTIAGAMVNLQSAGAIDVANTGVLSSSGDVSLNAADGMSLDGSMTIGGSATLNSGGVMLLDGSMTATKTEVQTGTLIVGGSAHAGATLGGNVNVDSGATLGGHGTIGGNVEVLNGGHLAPGNSIGTLTINGNFTAAQNSQLDFGFGAPAASGVNFTAFGNGDSVKVGANLVLGGAVLNVTDAGGFGDGLYNLFSYGGTLTETNGGITLGMTPAGDALSIQNLTSDKQINLINTTGLTLNFWNGNGLASSSQMGGGNGTWSTTSSTWTDANATVTASMSPQPGFAIFGGAAGTVTVSNSSGNVSALGLQFASDGYTLNGDTLTLVGSGGAAPIIRVGDGSAAGASYTATINNVLAGIDGLSKADLGTLVLTGINTYSGGTTITGGELSVSSDANLGDASGNLTLDGGLLQVTGTAFNSTSRTITLGSNGGGFDIADAGNTFTVTQTLGGSGGLIKDGAGTLVLSGANTYSDGTLIRAGTLQGDSSSLQGNIVDNASLVFAQNSAGTFEGMISGSGSLTQNGSGVLALTGANTYGGGTTIASGTLQIGDNGMSGSISGDVLDNGVLAFDHSDNTGFAGVISGSGSLTQNGTATLMLTGANTYSGGTTIASGTLQIGNGGTSGSITGDVLDNGSLAFDHSDNISFAGVISGSGALSQQGGGVLTLAGANNYSGGTTISTGTLQGDATSLQGNITDNAALVFDQNTAGTFAGAVSGSGTLTQNGSGVLTLSGANTYTGGTTISAGTLQVGHGGNAGSITGDVTDNGTLAFDHSDDLSFAGVVSGTGTLTQNGSGVLTLTGANSYSGGTTISAGTLQGDTTSLQGAITDNAALVFNQTIDGTFTGAISGNGMLTKAGTGLLLLDGNNTFTGTTTVQTGTLEVGDAKTPSAFLGGDVDVATGGTLRGHGSIGGNVINSGNLWAGGSIGTLAIQENYTQNVGSTFTVDALPTGQASLLTVGGNASLLGGNTVVLAQSGNWAPQTNYTILTATGGVSGTFASASSSLIFLNPVLSYSAKAVNLSLQRNDIAFASVAQTRNQRATATAADTLGFGSPVYADLTTLDAPTARHAFDQLSGVLYPNSQTALVDDSRSVRDAINRHLLGLNNDGSEATTDTGVSAWSSVWGHGGHDDSDGNAAALQAFGSGLLVGSDLALGSDARIGAVIGHGQNSIQSNSVGSSEHVLADQAGFYASSTFGGFGLRAGAIYAWEDVHGNRRVAFGNYTDRLIGDYHAQTAQAYVEGSYQFVLSPRQQLEPFLNVARVRVHSDALQEGGGSAALAVAANSLSVNTATLGLRDTLALDAAGGMHAHASLGWQQAWGGLTPLSTMRFASGGDSFLIAGVPIAQHTVTTDLGIDFKLAKNVTVDASYLGQFGSGMKDQGARMSLTVTF